MEIVDSPSTDWIIRAVGELVMCIQSLISIIGIIALLGCLRACFSKLSEGWMDIFRGDEGDKNERVASVSRIFVVIDSIDWLLIINVFRKLRIVYEKYLM